MDIGLLVWDSRNGSHIANKGIKTKELEEAIFEGLTDIRKGRLVKHGDNVLQRYYAIAKTP